jgi:DNA-binding NarL/FixJ family response regulator
VLGRLTIGSRVAPRHAHRGVHAATILGGTMTISAGRQASSRGPRRRNDRLRVVVADDSVLLREGIARLLETAGCEVAGQAADGEDLLRKVGAHKPDVAVVDVRMPPTHTDEGLRAAHRIRAEHPDTAVLVLSAYIDEDSALELLSQSAESTGYLLKDRIADVESFIEAVQRVADGGSALDPEVVALLLGRRRREDPLAALTQREREVLGLMAQGRSNSAMAKALVVTERAVEKHVTAIFSKLDLPPAGADHRRVLAVLAFMRAV